MKLMKTIIIDDEKQIRDGFKILLSHFPNIDIIGEAATVSEGIKIIENKVESYNAYTAYANFLKRNNQHLRSIENYQKALVYAIELDIPLIINKTKFSIARTYKTLKIYGKSIDKFNELLQFFISRNDVMKEIDSRKEIVDIYMFQGEFDKAKTQLDLIYPLYDETNDVIAKLKILQGLITYQFKSKTYDQIPNYLNHKDHHNRS